MTKQDEFSFAPQEIGVKFNSIQEQFEEFHRSNPWVYSKLKNMALNLKAKGHKKIGIGMLFEVLRWEYYMKTDDPSGWKLNNNYRSRYSRLIMDQEKDLEGIFETRVLRSE